MIVDHDCMEVTAAIVSQLRNVLPSAPKEYVCLSVCLSVCHFTMVIFLPNLMYTNSTNIKSS